MVSSGSAMVKPQDSIVLVSANLFPSRRTSERNFEHCVSPSPPGKRARPPRVGRVRMATARQSHATHPSISVEEENERACGSRRETPSPPSLIELENGGERASVEAA